MVVYSAPRPPGVIVGMRAAHAHPTEEQPLTTSSVKVWLQLQNLRIPANVLAHKHLLI